MQPYKCTVTNAISTTPLATPKAPTYCYNDPSKCVQGAKQMIAWNQLTGNNIDSSGQPRSPGYNEKCGFKAGAQTDIFQNGGASTPDQPPAATNQLAASIGDREGETIGWHTIVRVPEA